MNRNDLGTRLRALRTERGLSLSQLETETRISSSFLSLVESGKSDITISRLLRLADFYDVELGDLVEGSRVGRRTIEVVREGEGSVLNSRDEGVVAQFLGHSRWQLQPRGSEYEPGGSGAPGSARTSRAGQSMSARANRRCGRCSTPTSSSSTWSPGPSRSPPTAR